VLDEDESGDYDGAITNARSLVEAVLAAIEREFDSNAPDYDGDLPKLYKRVQTHSNLPPENPKISLSTVEHQFVDARRKAGLPEALVLYLPATPTPRMPWPERETWPR